MRNSFAGKCYMCRFEVAPGQGHFERVNDRWATIHAECVFILREAKDKAHEAMRLKQAALSTDTTKETTNEQA